MFVYMVMAVSGAIALIWRIKVAEIVVGQCALIGGSFTALALITGMLWGKPMWGAYWVWDARLTSVLILFLLYIGLIALWHAVKTAYAIRGVWLLNRNTLAAVRRLKDADKNYVWQPGLAEGQPNTILGSPYVEVPDMPNEGAGATPIAFGDFRRGYTIVDRIALSVLRDPFTQATAGNVRFIARRRVGGQVVLAEAIAKLICAVS